MVKVTFTGRGRVHVPALGRRVERGETVDVPAAVADALEPHGFDRTKPRKARAKKAPANKKAAAAHTTED